MSCFRCGRGIRARVWGVGVLRALFSGPWPDFQIPAGLLAERFGAALLLALGTALSGIGYCIAGASAGIGVLMLALFCAGLGSSTQHPLASLVDGAGLRRRAFHEGDRHLQFCRRHRKDDRAGGGFAPAGRDEPGGRPGAARGGRAAGARASLFFTPRYGPGPEGRHPAARRYWRRRRTAASLSRSCCRSE